MNIVSGTKMIKIPIRYSWIICLCAVIAVTACDKVDFPSNPHVATVNGARIYLDEYQARLDQKKAMLPKDFLSGELNYVRRLEEEVLDNMITEKIMNLRAAELGLEVNSQELEEKAFEIKKEYGEGFSNLLAQEKISYERWKEDIKKEMLFEKLIAADVNAYVRVSEDEAEDYFNEHPGLYKTVSKVRVAQIFVRDMAAAQEVVEELKAGADFSKVAREKSIGPEARRGGDLGFITRQVMPEPLDETIFKLSINEISPIVKSSYGFHVLKIMEIKEARNRNFAECKEEVIADIRAKKEEAAFAIWLDALKMKAAVKKEMAVLKDKVK